MISMTRSVGSLHSTLAKARQISELDRKLGEASKEMTTSRKADVYRSLGTRSAQAVTLRAETERTEGFALSNKLLSQRLETSMQTLGEMRGSAMEVMNLIGQGDSAGAAGSRALQQAARAAIEQITGLGNRTVQGAALFSGLDSGKLPLQAWDETNPRSGLSPSGVIESIFQAGPANSVEAALKIEQLRAVFTPGATQAEAFEQTFYNGTPASETARLSARIDSDETLEYGVQANDPALTETLRGLAMLAAGDLSAITDPEARKAWTDEAFSALGRGTDALRTAESRMGAQVARLNDVQESQELRLDLLKSQITALEGVDPYEAATRLTELQTQLEATYAVTARLSKLSFLNYL